MRLIYTISTALLIAIVLGGLGIELDQPEAPQDVQRMSRFEKAAAQICGSEASWTQVADTTIQCLSKHGRKTIRGEIK